MSDVTCDNCGACCRHMVQPPFSADERAWIFSGTPLMEGIAGCLDDFNANIRPSLPEDWPCCWLDLVTMTCRHYELRPLVCRDNGGEGCIPGNDACMGHRERWGIGDE